MECKIASNEKCSCGNPVDFFFHLNLRENNNVIAICTNCGKTTIGRDVDDSSNKLINKDKAI